MVELYATNTAFASNERNQLAKSGTEFCSWITNLILFSAAAMQTGKETYPPVPMTIWGLNSSKSLKLLMMDLIRRYGKKRVLRDRKGVVNWTAGIGEKLNPADETPALSMLLGQPINNKLAVGLVSFSSSAIAIAGIT